MAFRIALAACSGRPGAFSCASGSLVETVRNNTTIDWTVREAVRARLRVMVKRILRKYGYPPDKQDKATVTVLQRTELIASDWTNYRLSHN
jgi:hypothetical protein